MSEIKLISPILDNYCIGDPISDKNGVRSCPAMKENEDDRYILKVVSIPASQTKLEALLLAGAYPSADAANAYFLEQAQAVIAELEVLNSFTEQEGFFPVRQWQLQPMDEGETGYDVYILTDYRRTLKRQFYKEPLTHLNAVNLGIDICAALTACRNAGYMYLDLKPTNILVTQDKRFKIGDLGFIKLDSLAYASLPERYRSAYTAPEVADAFSAISGNIDVYALGLVLYQAYNNGALPFEDDTAPAQVFDAPQYADDEMAAIILKACDPDPENRWQDPAEMGQALISYMQKFGANDTPIAPPAPVITAEPATETEQQEDVSTEAAEIEAEENRDEADGILDTEATQEADPVSEEESDEQDEALPYENSDDYIDLSFLAEIPDPRDNEIVPESADTLNTVDASDDEDLLLKQENHILEEEVLTDTSSDDHNDYIEDQSTVVFDAAAKEEVEIIEEESDSEKESEPEAIALPSKRKHKWIGILIAIAIVLGLAAGGYCGYKFYYIKTIDSITLDGKLDTLTVAVKSDADPALLTVYCVGNGTRIPADLVDGKATFTNLNPDQRYLIEVEISGLHGLKGKTSATYYTPSQVSLEGLLIQVGDTDGSAKITFNTKKPYSGQWVVEYTAEGEETQTVTSDSANITLNNLTVGKVYDISISPVTGNNWVANNTGTFTAQPVIRAQDVTIKEYKNGTLNLAWSCSSEVSSWTVHCYNNTDYNKTVTVSECAATFNELDPAQNYTVEIYADNQTQFQLLHIDDATLPVEEFTAQMTQDNFIELTWTCAKETPEGGWIIEYTMSESEDVYKIEGITDTTCLVKDAIPGATYVFKLKAANDAVVIASDAEITVPEADNYANNYGDTPFSSENIRLKMCLQPEDGKWTANKLKFTTTFKPGELAGFTTEALTYYNETVDAEIYILYVIRDEKGALVMFNSQELMWKELFTAYHGTLSIPDLPDTAGKYTLDIYYNGGYVATQEFEIVEQ